MQRRAVSAFGVVCLALCAAAARAGPATKADPKILRQKVGPAVCSVTVENAWGIPQCVSTGFLLGDGRFVVCDLGALKHRGASRAVLRFEGGATAAATQFGMADAALGLAALRTESGLSAQTGLALAPELPAFDTEGLVVTAGWRWGEELDVTSGRVMRGPKIRDVASRSHVATPEGIDAFLRVDGGRIEAASGAPVLGADGTVLAVRLDVDAKGMLVALAMPAVTLRKSLLSVQPELKPLTDLPEPLWPVDILRLPGRPTNVQEFLRASQTITTAMVCDRCKGKGQVDVGRWIFGDMACMQCLGTGIHISADVYDMLAEWSVQGTRVAWAPRIDERTRLQVRKYGVEMLARLAKVGRNLRRAFGFLGSVNLVRPQAKMPHGIILYAQVQEQIDGPDGRYLLLRSTNTQSLAAVRVEDLLGHDGKGPLPGRQVPGPNTWFALAATVVSNFNTGEHQGIYVLPFEWTPYIPLPEDRDRGRPPWDRDRGPGGGPGGGRGGGPGGGGRGR
ncbi:MAG: hypothetical protein AMS14_10570 [Planctomycetes bacterium DG_20]|nr:MAG: hypothetical protein AMS14_10570 [Planctomycetes bacterium DG_20]